MMKNLNLLPVILALVLPYNLSGQATCANEGAMQSYIDQDPNYLGLFNSYIQDYIAALPTTNIGHGPDDTYEIPMVFHIIHNNGPENISESQIHEAIKKLNDQFAGEDGGIDTKITFYLAVIDPDGNCTSGINRVQTPDPTVLYETYADTYMKNLSRWPTDKYLNVWIVKDIIGGNYTGYSYIPPVNSLVDGVVVKHSYLGTTGTAEGNITNTLTHEVGHYLSLEHVWGMSPVYGMTVCENRCHELEDWETLGDYVEDTNPCHTSYYGPENCDDWFNGCEHCPIWYMDLAYPKDNYMSYAHQCQIRFTPGQTQRMWFWLNTMRQELWSEENQLCTGITKHLGHNIKIYNEVTWTTSNLPNNGDVIITGALTVESGGKLTIEDGVKLHFCEYGKVVIKQGGMLINEGSLLDACDESWQGVEVWGKTSETQGNFFDYPNHGVYIGRSGSLIENAVIGLRLFGPDYLNDAGGMISCYDAQFKNNTTSIKFAPYNVGGDYSAYISACTFNNDGTVLPFESFLDMNDVKGVRILGSTFNYTGPKNGDGIEGYGYGIWAKNSGFKLQSGSKGLGPIRCTFNGLGYGIYISNTLGNRYYEIKQGIFENNYVGIYNNGMSLGKILFNDFHFGSVPDPTLISGESQAQIGVMLTNPISGVTFQQNDFIGAESVAFKMTGTISHNIGTYNNMIQKNYYTQLTNANIATKNCGITSYFYPTRGLLYLCNQHQHSFETDIILTDGENTTTKINNIQRHVIDFIDQTVIYQPAGNEFSHNMVQYGDLNNEDTRVHRYHFNSNDQNEVPQFYDTGWQPIPEATQNTSCNELLCEPPCPVLPDDPDPTIIKNKYENLKDIWDNICLQALPYPHNPYITSDSIPTSISEKLSGLQQLMDSLICTGLQLASADSIGVAINDYYWWLKQINSYEGELWLANEYLSAGSVTQADSVMNAVSNKWPLSPDESGDLNYYTQVYNIVKQHGTQLLGASEINELHTIYQGNSGYASLWAGAILNANGEFAPIRYTLPGTLDPRSFQPSNLYEDAINILVYPNPVSGMVNIEVKRKDFEEGLFILFDVTGRVSLTKKLIRSNQIIVSSLQPGIYSYNIYDDKGNILQSNKLILLR